MKALIMCGGYGKRLEPVTEFVPKPLLPIGGVPLLEHILRKLERIGAVDKVFVDANKKFEDQFMYIVGLRQKAGYPKPIEVVIEPTTSNENKLGAIKGTSFCIKHGKIDDDLLFIAGDNFFDFDLAPLVRHFQKTGKTTIAVYEVSSTEEARRFGVVSMEGTRVTELEEKPEKPKTRFASTAVYIFPKEVLKDFDLYLADGHPPDAIGSFLSWLLKKAQVEGVVQHGEWADIGTLDSYREVFRRHSGGA